VKNLPDGKYISISGSYDDIANSNQGVDFYDFVFGRESILSLNIKFGKTQRSICNGIVKKHGITNVSSWSTNLKKKVSQGLSGKHLTKSLEGYDFLSKLGFRVTYLNNDVNPNFNFWGNEY